jgi:hypothetical protein
MRCAFRDTTLETKEYGFARPARRSGVWATARQTMAEKGVNPVAADGFGAPGVVVCYTDDPDVKTAKFSHGPRYADCRRCRCKGRAEVQHARLPVLIKLCDVDETLGDWRGVVDRFVRVDSVGVGRSENRPV